jgi:hypothetical protein
MATVPFVKSTFNGNGDVYTVTLSTGDQSNILHFVQGEENVSVLATGTVGGSTVTVRQTLDGTTFGTAEAVDGAALALTTIGVVKRVASAGIGLDVIVSAGAASGLVISVFVPRRIM